VEPNLSMSARASKSPDMTKPATLRGDQRHPREKATDEFSRLVIFFGYLWVTFELLSVHKSIVLSEYHLNYPEHAFAIVNCLVFAKVLLTQNPLWDIVLKLLRCLHAKLHPRPREASLWAIDHRIRSLGITAPSSDSGA
jgi:hypothetical protein